MATAVAVGPGTATLTPALGGAVLRSVIGDAHIITTPSTPPPSSSVAAVGSAVVGTSTVG